MTRYLNIRKDLQIVRGEGCGFVAAPTADLESVEVQVVAWLEHNETHPDAAEAQRWLDVAAPKVDRARKERQVINDVAAFRSRLVETISAQEGTWWASWRVDNYHREEIKKYEEELRQRMGLE
jgi:hypothetical protein